MWVNLWWKHEYGCSGKVFLAHFAALVARSPIKVGDPWEKVETSGGPSWPPLK